MLDAKYVLLILSHKNHLLDFKHKKKLIFKFNDGNFCSFHYSGMILNMNYPVDRVLSYRQDNTYQSFHYISCEALAQIINKPMKLTQTNCILD